MPAVSFRVATFNLETLGGKTPRGASLDERIAVLRPQILRLRADVLCLQEVDGQRRRKNGRRRLLALDRLLAGTPYESFHRATSVSRSRGDVRDKHNLVVLSRFPVTETRQVFHDLVTAPSYRPATARPAAEDAAPVEWDRPFLYAALSLDGQRTLHVINLHLRAHRAAFVEGQKSDAHTWRTMPGWAEGFFLAAIKRAGQALEARLFIDRLMDADRDAMILVSGDFNADAHETPVRAVRGDEEDTGNPHLTARTLVPLDRSVAQSQRFSVVHHGRPQMLDHLLVSRPLLAWYRTLEVHNEALGDELITPSAVHATPESFHAPMVAEFEIPDAAEAPS